MQGKICRVQRLQVFPEDCVWWFRPGKIKILKGTNDEELVHVKDKVERLQTSFSWQVSNWLQFEAEHVFRITFSIQHLEFNCTTLLSDLKNIKKKQKITKNNHNNNKASGPDGISARNLAIAGSSTAAGLSTVFKHSLATNSFHVLWKMAKINATFKRLQTYISSIHSILSLIGERLDEVFASLNMIVDNVLQWSKNNQLTIHPFAIKTEAMLMRKSSFIAPLPPLSFWSGTIRVVQSTTCLGFKPDCRLSWSEHVSQVRKSFAQKCFKRMKYFPVKTLQETSFKIIIPSLTYCIKYAKTALKPSFLLWTWYIRRQWEVFLTSLALYFFFLYWKSLSLYSGTRFISIPCLFELMN